MNVLALIISLLMFYAGIKLFRLSHKFQQDAEHWSGVKGVDTGRNSRANYTISFVLGIIVIGIAVYLLDVAI